MWVEKRLSIGRLVVDVTIWTLSRKRSRGRMPRTVLWGGRPTIGGDVGDRWFGGEQDRLLAWGERQMAGHRRLNPVRLRPGSVVIVDNIAGSW